MRIHALLCAVALTAGCATRIEPSAQDMQDATAPLICKTGTECQVAWRRAQVWLVQNSRWKIQTATDAVIDTYNGDQYTPLRHFTITREPLGNDTERIRIASACQNMYGCTEDMYVVAARFKRYVREGMR